MNRSAVRATRLTRSYLCLRLPGSGASDPEESRVTAWAHGLGSQDKVETVVCPTTWSLPVRGRQALAGMAVWSPKRLMLGPLRSKGPCAPRHHSIPSCFTVTITNVDTDLPPSLPATEGVISAIVDRRGDDGGGGGGGGSGGRPWPK